VCSARPKKGKGGHWCGSASAEGGIQTRKADGEFMTGVYDVKKILEGEKEGRLEGN